jgi:hypothetical protein
MSRIRGRSLWACIAVAVAAAAAQAQIKPPPQPPNQRQVYLVWQDFSDCTNNNVPNVDGPNVGGNVWVTRGTDGNTVVRVGLTGKPNTTYHFFLKCAHQLGDVVTGEEGVGTASFIFPTNTAGNIYAFDSYPEGAPAGNKFQSAQVKF